MQITFLLRNHPDGEINSASTAKTNFWNYAAALFGSAPKAETGLAGYAMPSGVKNFYPMMRITARDNQGLVMASAPVVFPVSDEMECAACHGSTTLSDAAKPEAGWIMHADAEKDFQLNILRLHAQKVPGATADNAAGHGR